MNSITSLAVVVVSTVIVAFASSGRAQTYQYNIATQEAITTKLTDTIGGGGATKSIQSTNALSETAYLDPVAETMDQSGTFTPTQPVTALQFTETESVPSGLPFPNPPFVTVTGTVALTLAYLNTPLSFDTGTQPMTFQSGTSWTFGAPVHFSGMSITGTYSLVTGAQTYSGTFDFSLNTFFEGAHTFTSLSTVGYPSSIILSNIGGTASDTGSNLIANVTAANGFQMNLLDYDTSVQLTQVPEPTSLFLLAFGMLGIINLTSGVRRKSGLPLRGDH